MNRSILILGRGGQLARSFMEDFEREGISYRALSQKDLDIRNHQAVHRYLEELQPRWVINCAAFTNVDLAETNTTEAFKVNAEAVDNLSYICKQLSSVLIHFSTDYVYHNDINRPLRETDACTPQSVYGQSKWDGEQAIRENGGAHFIFRISWLFAPWGQNFFNTISNLAATREELRVVSDQIGTPTYAPDVAQYVRSIIHGLDSSKLPEVTGTYNLTQSGVASWYDFARSIIRRQFPDTRMNFQGLLPAHLTV
jgi:dTDP-4-dehydrorhamnose reductase